MPPVQCPECGRFLKKTFVAALADAPAPCPGCGTELRPEVFDSPELIGSATDERSEAPSSPTQRAEDELHGRGTGSEAAASVRPPDLPPEQVRDRAPDVLSGWDPGVGADLDARSQDRPPFPTDAAIVAGAGLAGLVLGAAIGRERRAATAAVGAVTGIVVGAAARRIWRLET